MLNVMITMPYHRPGQESLILRMNWTFLGLQQRREPSLEKKGVFQQKDSLPFPELISLCVCASVAIILFSGYGLSPQLEHKPFRDRDHSLNTDSPAPSACPPI